MSLVTNFRPEHSSPVPGGQSDRTVSVTRWSGSSSAFSSILAGRRALSVASQASTGKVGGTGAAPAAREFGAVQLLRSLPQLPHAKHGHAGPAASGPGGAAQNNSHEARPGSGSFGQISSNAEDRSQELMPLAGKRNFVLAPRPQSGQQEPLPDVSTCGEAAELPPSVEADRIGQSVDQSDAGATPGRLLKQSCGVRAGSTPVCFTVSVRGATAEITARMFGLHPHEIDELDRRIRDELSARGQTLGRFRLNGASLQPLGRR